MTILRHDVTTNDWVIFSPERGTRPHDVAEPTVKGSHSIAACPFCPGNEPVSVEVYADRPEPRSDGSGWRVRVVRNKYPALDPGEPPRRVESEPLYHEIAGTGAHEVLIESPDHDRFLSDQSHDQVVRIVDALHARYTALVAEPGIQAVIAFKNHGQRAGASLRHPHWQLIATPVVPHRCRVRHAVAADFFDRTGRCVYCDLVRAETAAGVRVVTSGREYLAIVPYAARLPYETWILPTEHESSFGSVDRAGRSAFAAVLKDVLGRLRAVLGDFAFNLVIESAPQGDERKPYFLWHVRVLPHLAETAGFELGSGMAINTVLPEVAAKALREATPGTNP